ncbi:MAG TPA: hypothetical protein VGG48_07900 [Rhizomicrobium sp.]|jgi:hypothetical protein
MSNKSGTFTTPLFRAYDPPRQGSGVGICLSGGGSRAMSAGIGQLQALEKLGLLGRADYMTTVSGGGWIGVPFIYQSRYPDAVFLGSYADPAGFTVDNITAPSPPGWIGGCTADDFTIGKLAAMALYLGSVGVPHSMIWQILMGIHFLAPYNLYNAKNYHEPKAFFSFDKTVLEHDVLNANDSLKKTPAFLVNATGQHRPYLISVSGMFVDIPSDGSDPGETIQMLAPLQSTPIWTGVLPTPAKATYGKHRQPVGGGGVSSFAFNSTLDDLGDTTATVDQDRQWSLLDTMGTSSAAFAAFLEQHLAEWSKSPQRMAAAVRHYRGPATRSLVRAGCDAAEVGASFDKIITIAQTGGIDALKGHLGGLGIFTGLVPTYDYWSPDNQGSRSGTSLKFADGGSLDNTGITSMLLQPGLKKIIAFVNAGVALKWDAHSNIIIDSSIPPLFGCRPYDANASQQYVPYASLPYQDTSDLHRKNQVFDSSLLDQLLNGLWMATKGDESAPPIFQQNLVTVENDWFGIPKGIEVTVLWVYLGMATDWSDGIKSDDVNEMLSDEMVSNNFPNYGTMNTGLSPAQVRFLSSLTAWSVLTNGKAFTALFP